MLTPLENFYLQQDAPDRGCLMALRDLILQLDGRITPEWKHKQYKKPYIGIVESKHIDHPDLVLEKRARMKILLVDPEADLPVDKINGLLRQAISKY